MLGKVNLEINIDIEKVGNILEKSNTREKRYIIMSKETAKCLKNSKQDGANYPYDCGYWRGCKVLFDESLNYGEIRFYE